MANTKFRFKKPKATVHFKTRNLRYHIAAKDGFFVSPEDADMFTKGSIVRLSGFQTAKGMDDDTRNDPDYLAAISSQNELMPVVTVKEQLSDIAEGLIYILFSELRQLPEHCTVDAMVLYYAS